MRESDNKRNWQWANKTTETEPLIRRNLEMKNENMTMQESYDDTWVDRGLDVLRKHRLHPIIEWGLAYIVAFGCLLFYGFSYLQTVLCRTSQSNGRIPLVTCSRSANDHSETALEAFEQMKEIWATSETTDISNASRSMLIQTIRKDLRLRRLVSKFVTLLSTRQNEHVHPDMQQLQMKLDSVWHELLRFPPIENPMTEVKLVGPNPAQDSTSSSRSFDISLIVPAFRENGSNVARVLDWALEKCLDPSQIQVIIVDAGQCVDLERHVFIKKHDGQNWGEAKIVKYTGGGGRGPSQNFGVDHAEGRILTFLHCDTLIPSNWDHKIKDALLGHSSRKKVQACAFCYGHDTSDKGLDQSRPYPWGIRSVWFLANLRAFWFNLPYGDHIISVPAAYFRYIGGFPMQKIMEDYDLMHLLRQRAKQSELQECWLIIGPPTSRCSVRRWQSFGVAYVTLVNALIVYRYSRRSWSADNVFDYYYKRPFAKKEN
jgi:hypothetical protein